MYLVPLASTGLSAVAERLVAVFVLNVVMGERKPNIHPRLALYRLVNKISVEYDTSNHIIWKMSVSFTPFRVNVARPVFGSTYHEHVTTIVCNAAVIAPETAAGRPSVL